MTNYGSAPHNLFSGEKLTAYADGLVRDTTCIKQICYIVPGFKQHFGSITLLWRLWRKLEADLNETGQTVQVRLWNNDWKQEADFIRLNALYPPQLQVVLIGYSWGAGWGCIELAKHLEELKVFVDQMCLIDPVYRHPLLVLRWLAYFPSVPITIPANVGTVTHWRQTRSRLQGHKLHCKSRVTKVYEAAVYDNVEHRRMDDIPEVIYGCHNIVKEAFS